MWVLTVSRLVLETDLIIVFIPFREYVIWQLHMIITDAKTKLYYFAWEGLMRVVKGILVNRKLKYEMTIYFLVKRDLGNTREPWSSTIIFRKMRMEHLIRGKCDDFVWCLL